MLTETLLWPHDFHLAPLENSRGFNGLRGSLLLTIAKKRLCVGCCVANPHMWPLLCTKWRKSLAATELLCFLVATAAEDEETINASMSGGVALSSWSFVTFGFSLHACSQSVFLIASACMVGLMYKNEILCSHLHVQRLKSANVLFLSANA